MAKNLTIKTAGATFKGLADLHIKTSGGNKNITSAWIKTASGNKQIWPNFTVDTSSWHNYYIQSADATFDPDTATDTIVVTLTNSEVIVVSSTDLSHIDDSIAWRDGTGTIDVPYNGVLLTGDSGGRLSNLVPSVGGSGPKYSTFTDTWRSAGVDNDIWVYVRQTTNNASSGSFSNLNTWIRLNVSSNWTISSFADGPDTNFFRNGVLHFNFARTGASAPTWTPDPDIAVTIPDGSFRFVHQANIYPGE